MTTQGPAVLSSSSDGWGPCLRPGPGLGLRSESVVTAERWRDGMAAVDAIHRLAAPAFIHDGERFIEMNAAWEQACGYRRDEIAGHRLNELVDLALVGRAGVAVPVALRRRDGSCRWLMLDPPFGWNAAGQTLVVATDVTALHAGELAARVACARSERTLDCLGDAVVRTDGRSRIEYLNPAAHALLEVGQEALGQPLAMIVRLVSDGSSTSLDDLVRAALEGGTPLDTPGGVNLARHDGSELAVQGSISPLADATGVVLVLRDVAALRALEAEMDYLARHDELTGLLNRRELEAALTRAITSAAEENRHHALLCLDLDEFKLVNDTCGHLAGDELLRQVAAILASRLRRSDCLARLGGDEFGLVLFDCDSATAREVAEEMRRRIRAYRFAWNDQIFEIGASIGLVAVTAGGGDLKDALRGADSACSVAKAAGGNAVHAFSLDDTAIGIRHGEMLWVHRLRRALDEGRLRLHYQIMQPLAARPPLRLCEVLVRILDLDGTLHSAARFIGAAERYGMIEEVDRWVVETAFSVIADAHRACAAGSEQPPVFAINVSARSLGSRAFLEFVLAELTSSGAPGTNVCFEITETAAISNLNQAKAFIAALKALGCRIALDDFGRGLSSFAYLRDLEVDLLKIDGEFVHGLATDSVHRALVAAIHQVGRVMGIATVAEGVEDRETLDVLRELGLDYAQGRFCAEPKPLQHDLSRPRRASAQAVRTGAQRILAARVGAA